MSKAGVKMAKQPSAKCCGDGNESAQRVMSNNEESNNQWRLLGVTRRELRWKAAACSACWLPLRQSAVSGGEAGADGYRKAARRHRRHQQMLRFARRKRRRDIYLGRKYRSKIVAAAKDAGGGAGDISLNMASAWAYRAKSMEKLTMARGKSETWYRWLETEEIIY